MFTKKTATKYPPSTINAPAVISEIDVLNPTQTTLKHTKNRNTYFPPNPHPTRYSLALKLRARNAYVAGEGSLPVIAKQFGINASVLATWCRVDKWGPKRDKFIAAAKAKFEAQIEPASVPPHPSSDTTTVAGGLDAQRIMIAKAMMEAKSGRELRDLAMAQKLVLDSWSLVTGHPRPGTRRQSKRGSAAAAAPASFEPLEPDNTQEPGSCGVDASNPAA